MKDIKITLSARDTAIYFGVAFVMSLLLKVVGRRRHMNVFSFSLCMTMSAICAKFITAAVDGKAEEI